jgi:hypothetical protein
MGTGIREYIAAISPTWLTGAVGDASAVAAKVMYTLGLGQDLIVQKTQEGQQAHMPTVGTPTALPYIGADRVIQRGFQETDDSYAIRLQKAFDTWSHAGSPESVIWSILGYVTPSAPAVTTVADYGVWDFVYAGAKSGDQPTHIFVTMPSNWNWDGVVNWWRAWVIIGTGVWVKNDPWGTSGRKWGDKVGTWGSNASRDQVTSVQTLVKTWKAAHSYVPWIILSFDDTWFSPWLPAGDPKLPDGLWGKWHKVVGGVAVASRTSNAVYWDGVI